MINGYLEALQDGTLAPTPERIEIIQQEVSQLNRLVRDLRTLSLADSGQLSINKDHINRYAFPAFDRCTTIYRLNQKILNLNSEKSNGFYTIFADEGAHFAGFFKFNHQCPSSH